MFRKLLSNLAFNPSLIGQVSFYASRLRKETAVRRAGLVILALAVAVQTLAVVSPPEASLARSNNDLVVGGITSREDAVSYCQKNIRDYKTILANYGISCENLAKTTTVSLKSTDSNKRLYSMGHLAYGKAGETPVTVNGVGTLYFRYLWSWDSGSYSTYKALKGTTASGVPYYILFNCGNLVFIGLPKPTPPAPKDVCDNKTGIQTKPEECDVCPLNPGVQKSKSECDLCPNISGIQNTAKCDVCPKVAGNQTDESQCDVCPKVADVQTDKSQCDVCTNIPGEQSSESECKPCEAAQSSTDLTACVEFHKTVSNSTQKIDNANNTTAQPGDTLVYTLITTNKGKQTVKSYAVSENISDVLDYADVVTLNGGIKDDSNVVVWPASDIKAGQTLRKSFTVRVKSTIPATPASSSDPGHFDKSMTNVYGDTVTVNVPPPTTKVLETTTQQLPNTGPGTSLLIAFLITAGAGYLFARSRLMAKELDIVRAEFGSNGGY